MELLQRCLSTLRLDQDRVRTCSTDFTNLELEYIRSLDSEELETLLFKESKDLIRRITKGPNVKIGFCGATNAGKSTLIRTLLGGLPLPNSSGHTTARICVIRYARLVEAKLYFCRLNTETSSLDPIQDGQISLSQYLTPQSLRNILNQHLSRTQMPQGGAQLEEAVQQIVVIEYPIPLLEGGVEIYDIPGQSRTDLECIKRLRQSFLRHINPHGMVFCFPNPAFSTEEINAYDDMLQSLVTDIGLGNTSRTFFANTKFESFSLIYDHGISIDELLADTIPKEEKARSGNLPKRTQHLNDANKEIAFKDYTYSLVNTLEFLEGGSDDAVLIFNRFIERLATWIVSQQQRRYATAYKRIADACNSFFRSYSTIRSKTIVNVVNNTWLNNGNEALEILRVNLLTLMDTILLSMEQNFEDFLVEHDLYNQSLAKARSIVHPDFEGLSRSNSKNYTELFMKEFSPWFQLNVLDPFTNILQSLINNAVEKSMNLVFDRPDMFKNELLLDVLQQSFVAGFNHRTSSKSIVYKNITPTNLSNLLKTATKHPVILVLVCLSVVGIIPSVISVIVASIVDVIRKIDDGFKVELTNKIFNEMRVQVRSMPKEMSAKLAETINNKINSIQGDLAARQEQLRLMYEKLDSLSNMSEMRTRFGRVEAEALSALTKLMDPSYIPVIDEDIGGGATGRVYKGTLKDEPVAIKTMSYRNPVGQAYEIAECMFFEEVSNSYHLTNKIGS
ncbi:hypothetical protein SAMD00019534_114630 [Acytostelium subglobosum LB1]|uniref:hypothetical protein n=1 Tax=Acytostelium subglobosum LB1 TaxID=1410327 RepID=UPI000645185D|nr:hypothetical protein SAMD00019534_114630 [Acytostelium subglobosum LB1]GAM28287.1 hypothetical protein SAMD00019534_114630 [Acytostelium subglobosum LB1]|eukprot:XP_012748921.1 hypothetical protein SAMD00019534_114630 [Acytostelium subglobosum LB1]